MLRFFNDTLLRLSKNPSQALLNRYTINGWAGISHTVGFTQDDKYDVAHFTGNGVDCRQMMLSSCSKRSIVFGQGRTIECSDRSSRPNGSPQIW